MCEVSEQSINDLQSVVPPTNIQDVKLFYKKTHQDFYLKKEIFDRLFPLSVEDGFYMYQKIGNCYLIATINAMRLNPYFMEELYKQIEFSQENNIFSTKAYYEFADGKKVMISIKDLKNQKEDSINSNKIKTNELEKFAKNVLMYLVKNGDIDELIKKGKAKYSIDSRGKKRVFFESFFIKEIIKEIIVRDGEYFDIINQVKEYKSIDAPIGYKILEALYIAKKGKSNKRKKTENGNIGVVLKSFLRKKDWDISNYLLFDSISREKIQNILRYFDNKNNIMVAYISLINYSLNITPYFEFNDYKMADGHAYSVIGFNEEKNKIEVVNPWDNNKIMYFSMENFFKIFTGVYLAQRKQKTY